MAAHVGPIHALIAHSMGSAAATIALSRGLSVKGLVYIAPPEDLAAYLGKLALFLRFPDKIASLARVFLEQRFGAPFEKARGSFLAPKLSNPLLIIHDKDDPDVPYSEGSRIHQCWPNSSLLSTQGLGHHRIVRDPQVIAASVDFIQSLSDRHSRLGRVS